MKVLLDTHAFLWWINDDPQLSHMARQTIANGGNTLFFSTASGWEIVIKTKLGKLRLPDDMASFLFEQLSVNAINTLPVQMNHALRVYSLPDFHRDPFDRLLIAQAQVESLPIITADRQFAGYQVEIIW
ncbi:MAG TPA: type II toxin-antitoxin system VapC family toxin [Firmicutes bacterium]|nr:type II toxin-antitoxin system VapC family toxin [Bacillota bacterium]